MGLDDDDAAAGCRLQAGTGSASWHKIKSSSSKYLAPGVHVLYWLEYSTREKNVCRGAENEAVW